MYPYGYNSRVAEIRQTTGYSVWFASLRDPEARGRINVRIRRLSLGNPGDFRSLGNGISELRIAYGPGYRVYFTKRGNELVILLAGGDKHTQRKDIQKARELAKLL
jgi:putative addiction module killer protein